MFGRSLHRFKGKTIFYLDEGENGELWPGTANSSLFIFNPVSGGSRQITEVNGLSNNSVVGILSDQQSNRWVSTFRGITVVSPAGEVLFDLFSKDGLINLEYNRTSYAKLSEGRLAFRGTEGIDILDPEQILDILGNKVSPQIFRTELEYFDKQENETMSHPGSYSQAQPISIPASSRYISLDFAISDYVSLPDHSYAYRITPLNASEKEQRDIPWTELGSYSRLTINNLPVGRINIFEYFRNPGGHERDEKGAKSGTPGLIPSNSS